MKLLLLTIRTVSVKSIGTSNFTALVYKSCLFLIELGQNVKLNVFSSHFRIISAYKHI